MSPLLLLPILIGLYLISSIYKGEKQKINFKTDIEINGLILRPDTPGPHPAILILHGAGDSHQGHNKLFFRFHANAFLEKGFAVMVYTKRGSGNNKFDYRYFTYKQLLNDAQAALKLLRNQKDIDEENIGVMGISESGWFTPELACLDGNLRFMINRVSSPFTVTETVIFERRNDVLREGFTPEETDNHILPLTKEIWQFYIDVYKDPSLANGPLRTAINEKLQKANNDERLGKWFTAAKLSDYDSLLYAARGQNYSYNPLPYLKKIDLPMYYVMGENDINMPTKDIVKFLKQFREEENKNIKITVYPEASHYLYKYGLEDGPYEGWLYLDGYPEILADWAWDQLKKD